jgi:hypothetical protein
MRHLSDEELVHAYYGEGSLDHLAGCESCREALARIATALNAADAFPVPERDEDYGAEVWARLAPRLPAVPAARSFWAPLWFRHRWVTAGAVAALILAAFFAGRFSRYPSIAERAPAPVQVADRQHILLAALSAHLDRSQRVLLEVMNRPPAREMDLREEQTRAADLVASSRLYRQAATAAGDQDVAAVLDDLERALMEIARSSPQLSGDEFEDLRGRIEAQGIVFKVRVTDSNLQARSALL